MTKEQIKELIGRRRRQMLIHSCIYYELDDNIISDHQWQAWADELQELQDNNPDCVNIGCFDKEFAGWTGATGNHLPHKTPWVHNKAMYILSLREILKAPVTVTAASESENQEGLWGIL